MPSKRQKKAGFELPDPVLGYPLLDVCLKIPNAPEYRRAFLGHLNKLGLWAIWEKSYLPGDTRARDAAELWRETLNQYLEMDCDMGCCPEPNRTRFNADGTYEISYDGGVTWESGENDDPRFTSPSFPPIDGTPGDDLKCKAANNVLQQMKEAQDGFGDQLTGVITIVQLALALAGLAALVFITGGAAAFMVGAFFELAAAIVTLTKAEYDAEFDSDAWDFIFCELFCNVGDDGQFTTAQFNTVVAHLESHFTGNVALTFHSILSGWQLPGMNNAARVPSTADLDCSACCPDCNSIWSLFDDFIALGQTMTHGDGFIEIEALGPFSGLYYVIIKTDDIANGCYVAGAEIIVSGAAVDHGYSDVNYAYTEYAPQFNPALGYGDCCNHIYMYSSAPFTVRFTMAECP